MVSDRREKRALVETCTHGRRPTWPDRQTSVAAFRRPVAENPSSYVSLPGEMAEREFLEAICACTGCGLLLDVNNIYVSARNHGFDAQVYLSGIPAGGLRGDND
jgi:Protein of unknown function (DUF692)